MALEILVKTGSGNGLVPDGTKPLPEPMLIYHQFCGILWQFCVLSQVLWHSSEDIVIRIFEETN